MDLTEIGKSALSHVPALVVALVGFLYLCRLFLRALERRDCTLTSISDRCHEMKRDGTAATHENTKMLGQTMEVIREATVLLRAMNGKH